MSKRAANSDKEKVVEGLTPEAHQKMLEIRKDTLRAEIAIDRYSMKKLQPIYERRREVCKMIPLFWPTAFLNHPQLAIYAQLDDDQEALKALEDVWVTRDEKEPRAYTIEMHFKENPYFSDKVLKKEFKYVPSKEIPNGDEADADGVTVAAVEFDPEKDLVPQVTKINWKDDSKNLTKINPMVFADGEEYPEEGGSFFNFFESEKDPYDIGGSLSGEVFPEADQFFLGIDDDEELDEDDEEEDDDDDDEDEIDLEAPRKKKARKA